MGAFRYSTANPNHRPAQAREETTLDPGWEDRFAAAGMYPVGEPRRDVPHPTDYKAQRKRARGMGRITEAEFQDQVIRFAQVNQWLVGHFRTVQIQRADGSVYFQTPVQADGAGFPDLVLLRRDRLVIAELKVTSTLSPEQVRWTGAFEAAGVETYVWKPIHWKDIEDVLGSV